VYFDWNAGLNNESYCVDTAESLSDLINSIGTWSEHGCGTHSTHLLVTDLECNTKYYWRVYAEGSSNSAYSNYSTVTTAACP
jgi:phosphodiesterase/alkaline phosphatase D-like protein